MLDKDGLNWEVSVGVTFASLMSATSLFFTGIIIAQYKSFNPSIKVPLIFLIISTFSFIFAATIYSNAGTEITLGKLRAVEKYMVYGKNIVEMLGLYLFVLATPLVIGAVTRDNFLRTATIIIAITGFTLYSQSKFSVLEKELTRQRKRYLTSLIVILTLCLYVSQTLTVHNSRVIYNSVAVGLVAVLVAAAVYFSLRSKQYKPIFFRAFVDSDAETLSDIVAKNLSRVKAKQYSQDDLEIVRQQSSPAAIRKLAEEKHIFVAVFNNNLVGLASLSGYKISNVFTDPDLHRKGIGRMLVDRLEMEARKKGQSFSEVQATTLDHEFYKKLGYSDFNKDDSDQHDSVTVMRKELLG